MKIIFDVLSASCASLAAALGRRSVRYGVGAAWLSVSCLTLLSISILHAQPLTYTTTWAGNNFGGAAYTTAGGWSGRKHVQLAIDDMVVDSDGTVYTDSAWDEGGGEASIYKNDDIIGNCQELSHGWGRGGGTAVAFDANYVYVAMHQNGDDGANADVNSNGLRNYPDKGTDWLCIRRFHKDGRSAPFPAGYGVFRDMMILIKSARGPAGYPYTDIHGLAVRGNSLYVSDQYQNRISVYDTVQMSGVPTSSWAVDAPNKINFDKTGRLWTLHGKVHPTVICFDGSGHLLPQQITFAPTVTPSAIAWDGAAGRLLVADKGIDQNIKLFDPGHLSGSPTKPASTLGVLRGIHSGMDGQLGPQRLFDPSGIGADASGNIYVANYASVDIASDGQLSGSAGGAAGMALSLDSYKPDGRPNWAAPLQCLEFVNCAEADAQSDTDVYSTNMHYKFDYSKPAGMGWKFKGLTFDEFKYPDDPRLHFPRFGSFRGGVWVRHINGGAYLFLTEQQGHQICVERLIQSSGEDTAAPYALVSQGWLRPWPTGWPTGQPGSAGKPTEWIWRDANGDGKMEAGEYSTPLANPSTAYDAGWGEWVDQVGDIWQSGHGHIRHFKMHLDARGRPVWDYAPGDVELLDPPTLPNGAIWKHGANPDDDDMDRIVYQPQTDTLYLSGFTSAYPDTTAGVWGTAGRAVYRFDHWSKNRTLHPGYPILLPWDSKGLSATKSISVAGKYLFAVQGSDPETVTVYNLDNAAAVGTMTPDDTIGKRGGWVDANYGISAHRRATGEYIVFVEEDLFEKALIYRWTPPHDLPL